MSFDRASYLAGFFDGEGSIGVYRDAHKRKRDGSLRDKQGNNHTAVMQVGGYAVEPLEMFKNRYGGVISSQWIRDRTHRVYYWKLNRHEFIELALNELKPYLLVKAEQAQLVLDFIAWRRTARYSMTDDEATIAADYCEKLKIAKHT